MSIKVNFEIGHEASIRTKRTPEGFTHDWEVFVRGVDTADISQFVDKVVFQLHETFPKPKRVVKDPPYCVKESGYAGFNLPIEIYLKNRDEPKKIKFNYDLHLQQSGPAIIKVQKEKYVFQNPLDEFRRKLLKGGGMVVTNSNAFSLTSSSLEHGTGSRDSFTEDKAQPLIGKPKLGGDSSKKHKAKEHQHRPEEPPRSASHFVNLFGPPIHKTSRVSPDPKRPSPNPKLDKKEKSHFEKEKQKIKYETKDKDYREDKSKVIKEEKDKSKDEKRPKSHKDRDGSRDKNSKRAAERPPSPTPPLKRPNLAPTPPPKLAGAPPAKSKPLDSGSLQVEKKVKKDKKSHDKDRETKKEHKKDKDTKLSSSEVKPKEAIVPKDVPSSKEKVLSKPASKLLLENFIKDPSEVAKHSEGSKHKEKGDRERKHKHKKKDKKRDESREKSKESSKEKKHKSDKHSSKEKPLVESKDIPEKVESNTIPREIDKVSSVPKLFKEKDRSLLTMSPISIDTSSQSSSKSASKTSSKASSKNPLSYSMMDALSCSSHSESEGSLMSADEDMSLTSETNSRASKLPTKPLPEVPKAGSATDTRTDKQPADKTDRAIHKSTKNKDKPNKHETKEEKKLRKRKSGSKVEESDSGSKSSKLADDSESNSKSKRMESSGNPLPESGSRVATESVRLRTDTKVQDDGVSSSLSDHPINCDSPLSEDAAPKQVSSDYMLQLKELQQRIMTIQSTDELERVVNLIAETGKYEITKKTFDFDLCLLDRSTVQQLQELIGSRA